MLPRQVAGAGGGHAEGVAEVVRLGAGRLKGGLGVLDRAPVVGAHEEDEDGLAAPAVESVPEWHDIAEGLRHLLGAHLDDAVVQPPAGELPPGAARLGQLVLVMGKAQVEPAAVNVEAGAEVLLRHGGALDVPARTPTAPGRIPPGVLIGFPRFPEREVPGILLPVPRLLGDHSLALDARKTAVLRESRDAVVHVAARLVREPARHQLAREGDDLGDGLGGEGLGVGPPEAECARVLDVPGRRLPGQLGAADTLRARRDVDPVVDVGHVLGELDVVAAEGEPALEPHRQHERPGIADMDALVDRGAAEVHAEPPRRRRQLHLPA